MSEKVKTIGTKNEVYKGKALKTRGGLIKDDLMKNKRGRIVSIKQYEAGLARYKANMEKLVTFKSEPKTGGNLKPRRKPKVAKK